MNMFYDQPQQETLPYDEMMCVRFLSENRRRYSTPLAHHYFFTATLAFELKKSYENID